MQRRRCVAVALAATAALATSACAGSDGGGSIVVGSVNTLSGPATFPEASAAAAAVFDAFNEAGGLDGQTIDYQPIDDRGDPSQATAAARDLVGSQEAVALVGGASLLECEINADYYAQEGISSIPGIGVDVGCFSSDQIAPANIGPYNDLTLTLTYGSEELGLENICVLLEIAGSTLPAYEAGIDRWTEATGAEPAYVDSTVPYGASDYTPYIVSLAQQGCDAVATNAVEPDAIGMLRAAEAQGLDDVSWLMLTSVYSDNFAEAASFVGGGVYVPAEFSPFTDADSEVNADWRALMEANDIPLTSFSQGGYVAATNFLDVIRSIDGDVTRESVNEALAAMDPIEQGMVGSPYVFGVGGQGATDPAGWPVVLAPGTNAWAMAQDDWLRLDE